MKWKHCSRCDAVRGPCNPVKTGWRRGPIGGKVYTLCPECTAALLKLFRLQR